MSNAYCKGLKFYTSIAEKLIPTSKIFSQSGKNLVSGKIVCLFYIYICLIQFNQVDWVTLE